MTVCRHDVPGRTDGREDIGRNDRSQLKSKRCGGSVLRVCLLTVALRSYKFRRVGILDLLPISIRHQHLVRKERVATI